MIGADVMPVGDPKFLCEGLSDTADFQDITGSIMYNFLFFGPVGTDGGSFFQLNPFDGAKILTNFMDGEEKPVTSGMIRF
jgi:hypothetical protein